MGVLLRVDKEIIYKTDVKMFIAIMEERRCVASRRLFRFNGYTVQYFFKFKIHNTNNFIIKGKNKKQKCNEKNVVYL